MFSGRPNFSLRNKKLTRRRSTSGATSIITYGASQAGIFAANVNNNNSHYKTNKQTNKELLNKKASLEISRPTSVSSLAPQSLTSSLPPLLLGGKVNIKIDVSLFLSSPEGTPSVNDIRGKPEMCLFEVSSNTTCGQLLPQVIDRVIHSNPSNAKRDPNLFYIASVDINTETRELRPDVSPLTIIQKSTGLISHFKLQIRPGTVIKVYTHSIVPGCEYKTVAIDSKTSCKQVVKLVLQAMRIHESIEKFSLQAFSPTIGITSCRIPLDRDDLALAALRGCGYEFCFILVRENTPGSEPQKRARMSKCRAKLSSEELRFIDSPDVELDDFSTQGSTKSSNVGRILIDGPSLNNLELASSLVSLTGLSFVSVDSNTDSNSFDETPCAGKQDNRMLPLPSLVKNSVTRSYSSPVYVKKKEGLVVNTGQTENGEIESRPLSPSSGELFLTPDSNVSPFSSDTSSPLPCLRFPPPPPPPPFDPISLCKGEESIHTSSQQSYSSKYNMVLPTEQDSGIGSPPQDTPTQEEGSRVSFPSETSLTSTGTTPSLAYSPGTLLYDLSVSSHAQRSNPAQNISLFGILKEFDVFTVEVVNSGQGLGMSLFDTGIGLLAVQSVINGGVIHSEGSIQQGDRIIEVNNKIVIGTSKSNVAAIIRNCIGAVKLVLGRPNKLKCSASADAIIGSDVVEEEIERLNRALKASKPVLSRLRHKNSCLNQQVSDMRKSFILLNQEQSNSIHKLESFEKDTTVLSLAVKGLSQSGKFQLRNHFEIAQLETIRREITRFCDEVHAKLATAKDKLKLAISQASNYKRENEQLTNELNTLQSELEKERLNFAKHKNMLDNIQSSACIDCKVKDKEISQLLESRGQLPAENNTSALQDSPEKCEFCQEKDSLLEQLENELTDKMLLIADQEAKLHTLRNRK